MMAAKRRNPANCQHDDDEETTDSIGVRGGVVKFRLCTGCYTVLGRA